MERAFGAFLSYIVKCCKQIKGFLSVGADGNPPKISFVLPGTVCFTRNGLFYPERFVLPGTIAIVPYDISLDLLIVHSK